MDFDTIVAGLKDTRDRIHKQKAWSNPPALSDIALKLATYNSYLGVFLSKLELEYLAMRSDIYKAELKKNSSATAAENIARYDTLKQRQAYESAKQLHKDTVSLITVLQSHLRILTEEARSQM